MTFDYETSLKPFWTEGKAFINGRDPLGIQNSSVSIYASLLPGLNNVTDRLRYYGFYCWLLTTIEEVSMTFAEQRDQYNYIRKAEFTLALYMSYYEAQEQGIAGSDFAKKKLQEAESDGSFKVNVKAGAEKYIGTKKGSVYWDFSSGILGQYYAGSLQNNYSGLGLISISDRWFFVTEVGKKLGRAYGETIGGKARELFFRIINSGVMDIREAKWLIDFSIANINANSDEGRFYREMFFSPDFSLRENTSVTTTYRRDSLLLFLRLLERFVDEKDYNWFPDYIYLDEGFIGTKLESQASVGWFYYFCCERIHLALEHMFYTILREIEYAVMRPKDLVNKLTTLCVKSLGEYYDVTGDTTLTGLLEMVEEEDDVDYPATVWQFQQDKDWGEALVYAFEYFLTTVQKVNRYQKEFESFAMASGTRDKYGTALDWHYYVHTNSQIPVKQFVEELLYRLINDHLFVAYSKMGNRDEQVHKFILEDNYLIHINNIEPRFTTPRIRSVKNFLKDMKMISYEDGAGYLISLEGRELMQQI